MKGLIAYLLLIGTSVLPGAEDPSLKPHPDPTGRAAFAERYRILVDLDGDGAKDMLLSGSQSEFGTMGGPWAVFLRRDGKYAAIGELWAHPLKVAFEADQARIHRDPATRRFCRIWVYLRGGGSVGSLGYYRVGDDSVDAVKSIEIYPGDSGTDLGRAIYEATFAQSPIPFTMQRSRTAEDGTVTWTEGGR